VPRANIATTYLKALDITRITSSSVRRQRKTKAIEKESTWQDMENAI
jgi:hypothetical protein